MAKQEMPNLIETWMEQQQKLWQSWMQNVQQASGGSSPAQPWTQGLSHWQEAVDQTLETQKKAIRAWADQVAMVEGAPEEMKRWASDGVNVVDQWTDAQHKMWQQWFELMGHTGGGGEEQATRLMAGWEQMATQMQELQRQWTGVLSGMAGAAKPKPKGGGKSGGTKTT